MAKAITDFTSDENLEKFFDEYPNCDPDMLAQDLEKIVDQLEMKGQSDE